MIDRHRQKLNRRKSLRGNMDRIIGWHRLNDGDKECCRQVTFANCHAQTDNHPAGGCQRNVGTRTSDRKANALLLRALFANCNRGRVRKLSGNSLTAVHGSVFCARLETGNAAIHGSRLNSGSSGGKARRTTITIHTDFLAKFPRDSVEPNTFNLMVIHLKQLFSKVFLIQKVQLLF